MHSRRIDNTQIKMYPVVNTNLKNLTCVNCKHGFSFRGAHQFRGKIPLLLECGHAICETCVKTRANKNCGICGIAYQHNPNEQFNISVNLYVLGLTTASQFNFGNAFEPNLEFQQPAAARFKKSVNDNSELCSECGIKADYRCRQCEVFFCNVCYSKIHGRALQSHQKISVAENANDIYNFLTTKCKNHPNETVEFYCNQCDLPACTHCVVISHQGHTLTSQSPKSDETREQIENAMEKLSETLQRIKMTEKKLTIPSTAVDASLQDCDSNRKEIEAKISQHFTYLHGVLQNTETRFINRLRERQNYIGHNVNALKEKLREQKKDVNNAILLATSALNSDCPLNTTAIIDTLEQALNVPCHLVYNSVSNEKIEFNIDESIVDSLAEHCNLYLPEISSYTLSKTEDLPDDYKIEPIVREPIQKPNLFASKPAPLSLSRNSLNASNYSVRSLVDKKPNSSLVEGSSEAVTVTHIKDPSCFYTQSLCLTSELNKLHSSLASQAITSPIPTIPEINKIYIVQYGSDMKWYRGRVKTLYEDVKNNQVCDIFYIDYGNTEFSVSTKRMRNMGLQSSLVPILAKQCTLHDIVPKDGQWEVEANKAMYAMIEGQSNTVMHVFKVQNDVYHVDITKNSTADGEYTLSVRDALIFLDYGCFISNERLRRINPQSMRKFFEEEIAIEDLYDVRVAHIETPDCIYVQKFNEGIVNITKLTSDMTREYGNVLINKGIIYTPQIGMPCAVRYTDKKWYRGRISNLLGNRKVEVFFIDFGDKREYDYTQIRRLHYKFMTVNALAFRISLKDVAPLKTNEWSTETKNYMKAKLYSKYLKIFVFSKDSDSYKVTLYIPKDQRDLNFNAMLVNEGFALNTGPSSQFVRTPRAAAKKRKRKNSKANKSTKHSYEIGDEDIENDISDESDPFRMQIHILNAESPDCIYVSDVKSAKARKKLTRDVQNYYNEFRSAESEDWETDSICIAYSAKDKSYHRAKIVEIIPPERVVVLLYDMGITETVTMQDLQSLHPKFSKIPSMAFRIKLAGILPCGGTTTWLSSSCDMLNDLINENQHSRFWVTKVGGTENGAISAILWVRETKMKGPLAPAIVEINSINRKLVKEGVALPVRGYKDEADKVLAVELRQQLLHRNEKTPLAKVEWIVKNEAFNYPSQPMTEQSVLGSSIEISETDNMSEDGNLDEDADVEFVYEIQVPPTLSKWIEPVPIRDDKFCAVSTNVDENCAIYLHSLEQNGDTLTYIDAALQAHFNGSQPAECDMIWAPNDLCIAQYHADNKWYRAQVLEVLDNMEIKVIYVDYGNVEQCNLGTLRKRVIMEHIPIQATRCIVGGLIPDTPGGKWPIPDLDVIHALVVDQKNDVTVLERNPDHLVISINLTSFENANLINYLRHNLKFKIGDGAMDVSNTVERCNDNSVYDSFDDADVVIEEFAENYMSNTILEPTLCDPGLNLESTFPGRTEDQLCDEMNIGAMDISDDKTPLIDLGISTESSENLNCQMLSDDIEQISSSSTASFGKAINVTSTPVNEANHEFVQRYEYIDVPDDVEILNLEPLHVADPTTFYARLDKSSQLPDVHEEKFRLMTISMQSEEYNPPKLENIRLYSPCSVKYTADDRWYRAMITEIRDRSNEVKVQYVDYGNSEYQPIDKIYSLADKWLALPMMSLKCNLWRVRVNPNNLSWQSQIDKFQGVFYRGTVTAKIKDRCSGVLDVELYTNGNCTKLLYASLLDEGLLEITEN